ncbi:MAG TPA: sigma-54 dependent transcriptional regulator [Thermomicrobiales bacterium]|nr:sigma-54 dependent transcriptional regulator [Thermomicrobiales bacterium]
MARILVADDDSGIRSLLLELFEDEGYEVDQATNGAAVIAALRSVAPPDLVMMDVRMPDVSGIDVLRTLSEKGDRPLPVIVMTAYGSASIAIDAIQYGAYDYVTKPFDLEDVLLRAGRFFERQALANEVQKLRHLADGDPNEYIIGNSPAMQDVFKDIGRVARTEATVLITGETGTGKELVATTIHRNSGYAHGPLIKVNCAALPETLLESELFGHEKGAFTGAIAQKKGHFERANRGTIFLDEIGEMTFATQKKLLRVLQEREFERVGGTVSVKVDVRVITATNKNLPQEVRDGSFREDLYFRLNVIEIYLPPLRERRDDIPLLVEHFLHKHRINASSAPTQISAGAMRMLVDHDWPGNVRELENTMERATIMAQGGVITEDLITFSSADQGHFIDIASSVRNHTPMREVLQEVERQMIHEALRRSAGDRVAAAGLLGLELDQLSEKLGNYGISFEASVV